MKYKHLLYKGYIPDIFPSLIVNTKRIPEWVKVEGEAKVINDFVTCKSLNQGYNNFYKSILGNYKVVPNINIDDYNINIWNEYFIANVYISGKALEDHAVNLLKAFTVAKNYTNTITHVAAIYLLQEKILIFDLSKWDNRMFYQYLILDKYWQNLDKENIPDPMGFAVCSSAYNVPLGRHISKTSPMFLMDAPYQIFLNSPQSKELVTGIEPLISKVLQSKQKCFVHAPYIYNICKDENWILEGLKNQLESAVKIKSSGVVVHLGSYIDQDIEVALNKQKINIMKLLEYTTPDTPLILETSAGEGKDTCCSPIELLNLVKEIGSDRLKLCVDTCHVFSVGYDPAWFLEQVLEYTTLVHYNDSVGSRGCCKDRHELAGVGCIGVNRMLMVKAICVQKNIPMVVE